jgi:hypothetical protein
MATVTITSDRTSCPRWQSLNASRFMQIGGIEGGAMPDAALMQAATSLIRAAIVEDFETAELIISQHDPSELTRAMAIVSAQGWTVTSGYNRATAVESLDVLASRFTEEAGIERGETPR